MSDEIKCMFCGEEFDQRFECKCREDCSELNAARCSTVEGDFYNGIEWFGAWLVDHAEGEIITEELIQEWAVKAWQEHLNK
jgi:hypothetical protein